MVAKTVAKPVGPAKPATGKPNPTRWNIPSESKPMTVGDLAPDESLEFKLSQTTAKLTVCILKVLQ